MNKSLLFTIDFPPHVGGVANYYNEICAYLPSDKIVVLAPSDLDNNENLPFLPVGRQEFPSFTRRGKQREDAPSPPLERGGEGGVTIHRKNLITNLPIWPKWLPAFWHLYKTIKKEKIQNVLVGQVLPLGTVTLCLSKIMSFQYFVFTHGMDILMAQKSQRKKILLKKILKHAEGIITNSEFTKKELLKIGVQENKITIIYPCPYYKPPASEEIKKEIIKKYNLDGKKIILSVGRVVQRKGFDMVITSMNDIIREEKNAVYLMVGGKGNYETELKNLIENSPAKENIIFIKDGNCDEIKSLFDLCDVFIMPSRQIGEDVEGFGIVYLEANLFGKPVIVGRSGGSVEAVIENETGLLVDPASLTEISQAVLKLLQNKDLAAKLGSQGKMRAEKEFTWDRQVEKLKSIL